MSASIPLFIVYSNVIRRHRCLRCFWTEEGESLPLYNSYTNQSAHTIWFKRTGYGTSEPRLIRCAEHLVQKRTCASQRDLIWDSNLFSSDGVDCTTRSGFHHPGIDDWNNIHMQVRSLRTNWICRRVTDSWAYIHCCPMDRPCVWTMYLLGFRVKCISRTQPRDMVV